MPQPSPIASGRWVVPLLLVVGVGAGIWGVWLTRANRPAIGHVVDDMVIPQGLLRVRAVVDSPNHMLEFRDAGDTLIWQAMIPPYAGRTGAHGLAASAVAASVRIARDGFSEVWIFRLLPVPGGAAGKKLGAFNLTERRPQRADGYTTAVVTLGDGATAYEFVGDTTFTEVTAIDLHDGHIRWRAETPSQLQSARLEGEALVLITSAGQERWLTATGRP